MNATIKDQRGYLLRYVGKKHHLADVRGYAYEHRLVAETKIGRRLKSGEEVHHKNEDKGDCSPENLIVTKSHAEHFVHHRKAVGKRLPSEPNTTTSCACGCGTQFDKFDEYNRPRKYAPGCSWRKGSGKRNSTEKAVCDCGCGQEFLKYDASGRPRRFVSGHNRTKA